MTDLRTAVLMYLAHHPTDDIPAPPYDAPTFTVENGTVAWAAGRPDVTAVALEVLEYADPDVLGWDGAAITMPGRLRYRPVGFDTDFWAVVCRRVGK